MDVLQSILRNRNKLTLVVGGSRRLGVPFHSSWPQHILLAVAHTVDVTFQLLVGVDRYIVGKLFVRIGIV